MVVMMLTEDFANHCVVDSKLLKWTMMTIPIFSTFCMLFCFVLFCWLVFFFVCLLQPNMEG